MNIRSLNANIYKIEEFLSAVEGLPDVIYVCETCLTILRPFVGKLHGYDFDNKVSRSNQSGGVAFFVLMKLWKMYFVVNAMWMTCG